MSPSTALLETMQTAAAQALVAPLVAPLETHVSMPTMDNVMSPSTDLLETMQTAAAQALVAPHPAPTVQLLLTASETLLALAHPAKQKIHPEGCLLAKYAITADRAQLHPLHLAAAAAAAARAGLVMVNVTRHVTLQPATMTMGTARPKHAHQHAYQRLHLS
jgi:hypothetical protein